jgi:trigger factor
MLVSKNAAETNKYELIVSVPADEFAAACDKVFKKRASQFQVPGFRKGKAPRKTIEKLYGEGVFFEEAVNDVAPAALEAAYTESGLEIVVRPEVEVTAVSKEEGVTMKAICIVKPEVTVKNYKGIKASKNVAPVTDEEVSAEIERMRNRNARTITVEDRAAANGDIVNIDFEGFVDGVAFDGGKAERFNLTLGSGQFIPGFEDQIVGHNTGDEFDVNVTFPEEYQAEELKGKPAVFKCKLHEITAKELPELDDEFVKDVSEFDTLDELKADITSKLTASKENAANTAFENALIDGVIANMEGEIPEEMYDARVDEMIQDFEYRLSSQGMSMDVYMQYTGMNTESLRASFKEQAARQVKVALALEKIVEAEGITATDEEVEEEVAKLVEQYKSQNITADQIKSAMGEQLKNDIAQKKAVELIKSTAVAE